MKIVVIGANGMLGSDLCKMLRTKNEFDVIPFTNVDVTDQLAVGTEIVRIKPNVIIHTAAWTDVDGCETNREMAYHVNALGTQNVALAAKKSGAFLIYISTDYVFDGEKKSPYLENDTPNPINVYGWSKLKGEKFVLNILNDWAIIRTSWLFGHNGKNFVKLIIKQISEQQALKVVDDQIGSPTYTRDLSNGIIGFLKRGCESGIYHLTNQGFCSWFEFAKRIVDLTDSAGKIAIEPVSSLQLARPAKRPRNSVLENYVWKSNGYPPLQNWEDALKEYLHEDPICRFKSAIYGYQV